MRDKRLETQPKYNEPEHLKYTSPLRSSMRNADLVKSRGGVAIFYPKNEVERHGNLDEFDERPVSPTRLKISNGSFVVNKDSKEGSGSRHRTKAHLYHNRRDLERFSCSPKPNESLQKLHERDTEIALKRREKLEFVRNKDKVQERHVSPISYKNVKTRVGSATKRDKANRSHICRFEKRSQSPTGNTG